MRTRLVQVERSCTPVNGRLRFSPHAAPVAFFVSENLQQAPAVSCWPASRNRVSAKSPRASVQFRRVQTFARIETDRRGNVQVFEQVEAPVPALIFRHV